MLNFRINKSILKKVIVSVMLGITLSLGVLLNYNQNKLEEIENKLQMKQDIDHRNEGTTNTVIDVKSIENEFNRLNSYSILTGNINLKHKYEYNRNSVLGLKSKGVLTATATAYYEYKIDLSSSDITVDVENNTINIELPDPTLNENSVHRKVNTFRTIEDETDNNILMNDLDGVKIMRYWEDSYDVRAIEEIKDYYLLEDNQKYLKSVAKKEIKDLLNTLGYNKLNIKVKINN